jgi:hypothetical protein
MIGRDCALNASSTSATITAREMAPIGTGLRSRNGFA